MTQADRIVEALDRLGVEYNIGNLYPRSNPDLETVFVHTHSMYKIFGSNLACNEALCEQLGASKVIWENWDNETFVILWFTEKTQKTENKC